ncbi:SMI1/KNR4 family protein [Paenibacillus periandrae]|uniref:SMI1/KNR4 family protein n=1 Tax=Paenibacillus periandrae TaxID=1761741 RepID=UPI001F088EDC|nr:SMI1/KNR4 family protein [Paenibacillus periandrae]
MDTIRKLLAKIENLPYCIIYPATTIPSINGGHILPQDVHEFYHRCGGLSLYSNSDFAISVVPPKELILANPVIVGEKCEDDISSTWYTIAKDDNGDYLTIDLQIERLGKCYDSFWDRHGVIGDCPVIANSFTDLLKQLIENGGNRWYWLENDFVSLGDAYDDVV